MCNVHLQYWINSSSTNIDKTKNDDIKIAKSILTFDNIDIKRDNSLFCKLDINSVLGDNQLTLISRSTGIIRY